MLKSKNKYGLLLILLIMISLTGCGGGGGGSKTGSVYHVSGTGVILQVRHDESCIEGQSLMKSALPGSVNPALKQLDLKTGGFKPQTFKAASLTPAFVRELKENTAYIVLEWDQVNGAKRYQVYYCVNDEEKIVWDSNEEHPNDPDSDRLDIAYLDLDEELSDKELGTDCIDKPGQYDFRVYALKSDNTVIYQFGTVTVSLGMILGDFPTNINYDLGTNQLTWGEVAGADGYRIEIYKEAGYNNKIRLFDSFEKFGTLIKDTSFDLTEAALDGGSYYEVIVNAYAVGGSGQPLEITRGIDGFELP